MLILFESFFGILPLNPGFFFHHLVEDLFYMFVHAFDTLKNSEHRF